MKKYTTVLFDLDGTLVDSGIGVTNSVAHAMERFGITPPPRQELFKFIGPPLVQSFRDFCGFNDEQITLGIKYYREYYSDKGILECTMYDGVLELMQSLKKKGYKLSLATSKPDIYATRVAEIKGILPYLDHLAAASTDEKTRATKEAVVEYALELCEEKDRSKILMVGDRHFDINGAKSFGLDSVGVTFGYGSYEELKEAGATYIVNSMKELDELL
ncbi:MAG: HAD hydrolase-like protein [Clostridia bacterium]|nr:HAD hydrolase-like protein [Clostridia bacterium]